MKYLLFICLMAAACSSARKSANQQKQEVKKTFTIILDSAGKKSVDSVGVQSSSGIIHVTIDSAFDKITEEEIKEQIDSGITHRETKRIIKERGQKRTEQSAEIILKDSLGKQIREQAEVRQVKNQDSTAITVVKNKQVKRVTLLPWWVWLIAVLGLVAVLWWKKNSIIDFFI